MGRKYHVEELPTSENVRIFRVGTVEQAEYERAEVWWYDSGYGACTNCSSALRAMSGSCVHVQAVKRHLGLRPPPKTQPPVKAVTAAELRERAVLMRRAAHDYLRREVEYLAQAEALEVEAGSESRTET